MGHDSESAALIGNGQRKKKVSTGKIVLIVIIALLVAAGIVLALLFTVGPLKPQEVVGIQSPLAEAINRDGLYAHLAQFSEIASRFNNSRSVSRGYNASAEYVRNALSKASSLSVSVQYFTVSLFESRSPARLNLTEGSSSAVNGGPAAWQVGRDYNTLGNMGSANLKNVSIRLVLGDSFEGFPAGSVAMFPRDLTTAYRAKINASLDAGAVGVLIYQPTSSGGTAGATCVGTKCSLFPGLGLSLSAAADILGRISAGKQVYVDFFTDVVNFNATTLNVIAETKEGRADKVIVVGSHLDSVPAGPGINDDGSGSAWLLEAALNFDRLKIKPVNKVRFAWWSAEEIGLLGSYAYVRSLENVPGALANISLNLNYDMIGSPNGFRGVYDGRNAVDPNIRTASGILQDFHEDYFKSFNQTFESTPFTGRSDYGPFIEKGIPAGGLFSGAEEIKSVSQRKAYGGNANVAFDQCYHAACDDLDNIDWNIFLTMGKCAAFVVEKVATAKDIDALLKGTQTKTLAVQA